jgi:phosphoglycerol geranylgeranyltransferase
MSNKILKTLQDRKAQGLKSFAWLIDPDKFDEAICDQFMAQNAFEKIDFIFVGGSLINGSSIQETIQKIKRHTDTPVIIFPGNNMHIALEADAILFLSLISGRNPEFLIGQHIIAAPFLKKSKLEILPTGYMLIEGGKPTTVSYISNTTPIPHDKPEVAACTAMAGEMLGLQLIYADAGSGADKPISSKMIALLSQSVQVPLIIGGGIRSAERAVEALDAGADMIVIGNAIEENPMLLNEIDEKVREMNKKL